MILANTNDKHRPVPLWREMHDMAEWDRMLTALGGHPLQSYLWGEARKRCDGVSYRCVVAELEGRPVAMARVENRRIAGLGNVAWIPRGPVAMPGVDPLPSLQAWLGKAGYLLLASSSWEQVDAASATAAMPRTIWLDLTLGKEQLLLNCEEQFRYGVRRAEREGVMVESSTDAADVAAFYRLCTRISDRKGFRLPGTGALMQALLQLSSPASGVRAELLVARYQGSLLAGALVLGAGSHLHYMWGGVDRDFPKQRAGEAVQWAVIEWALRNGYALYDLEGIDPVNNPGTYQFKKRMGGSEVVLAPETRIPLDWRGHLVLTAMHGRQWLSRRRGG